MTRRTSHACPRCGAQRLYRSRARSFPEQLVRTVTPFHVYRCHACGLRNWTFGRAPRAMPDQKDFGLPTRPLESRDSEWWRKRRRRIVLSVLVAATVGAATALWFIG